MNSPTWYRSACRRNAAIMILTLTGLLPDYEVTTMSYTTQHPGSQLTINAYTPVSSPCATSKYLACLLCHD